MTSTRRRFSQGLGACLALAVATGRGSAHDGPHVVEVRIADFAFAPERVEISAGDTIVWINDDLAPHTASATDGTWDTGAVRSGKESRLVFETPGEFPYLCAFHPHMTGSVVVRPRASA